MATVTTPYAYVDGNTFDPAQHNENISSDVAGQGIMSEPNGGLEAANLNGAFRISREHVQIGQASIGGLEYALEPCDYVSDAFPSEDAALTTTGGRWVPITGNGIRFYVTRTIHTLMLQWTVFVSPYRIIKDSDPQTLDIDPSVVLKARYDGSLLEYTRRFVPCTVCYDMNVVLPVVPATYSAHFYNNEDRNCYPIDMAHMAKNVSKGWHRLSVCLHLEVFDESYPLRRMINNDAVDVTHQLNNRLTVGIRNVRYVGF